MLPNLNAAITKSINDLMQNSHLQMPVLLNSNISDPAFQLKTDYLPMYFSGNLNSRIVFIDFNPGPGDLLKVTKHKFGLELSGFESKNNPTISDTNSYLDFFESFGTYKVEHQRENREKLKVFDSKQLNFFKGFGALDLENFDLNNEIGKEEAAIYIRNEKLQLEWVPFGSRSFSLKNFSDEYLNERLVFLKEIIDQQPRDVLFIVGKHELLEHHFGKAELRERIPDGKKMSFTVGKSVYKGIPVIFIQSYKRQGLNGKLMEDYGAFCREVVGFRE